MTAQRTEPGSKRRTLRVAAAQMKFAGSIAANLAKIETAIARAARRKADVLLFPECATTSYAFAFDTLRPAQVVEILAHIGALAAKHQINVLVGTAVFAGRKLHNGLVVFNRTGHVTHCYAKCQLTESDRQFFHPGDGIALFDIEGVRATAIICHERRYPELVRLAAMAGARILFHPNAGMDTLAVSRRKRGGRDGIVVRAFENAIYYVFANSVGSQGGGAWSAGDSKIVAPDGTILRLADNRNEALVVADLDLAKATGKYALDSLDHPRFLAPTWRKLIKEIRRRTRTSLSRFSLPTVASSDQ